MLDFVADYSCHASENGSCSIEIRQSSPANIEYEIQLNSTGVCITCTFLDSSTTDCVVVIHQQISQLNSSGLMNIIKSHKFIKYGNEACGCIEVDMKKQQVGVIGGVRKTAIISSGRLCSDYVVLLDYIRTTLSTFLVLRITFGSVHHFMPGCSYRLVEFSSNN